MTSETLQQENAIVLATMEEFIELGQISAERILNGKICSKHDAKAEEILELLTAYRRKDRLSDDNLESLLLAMKKLSGETEFPSVDPIVGQAIVYRITNGNSSSGGGGGGGLTSPYYRGNYNPASGNPPSSTTGSGEAGAIIGGDEYYATDGTAGPGDGSPIGNVFGQSVYKGCIFKARVNGAGNNRNEWWLSQDGY